MAKSAFPESNIFFWWLQLQHRQTSWACHFLLQLSSFEVSCSRQTKNAISFCTLWQKTTDFWRSNMQQTVWSLLKKTTLECHSPIKLHWSNFKAESQNVWFPSQTNEWAGCYRKKGRKCWWGKIKPLQREQRSKVQAWYTEGSVGGVCSICWHDVPAQPGQRPHGVPVRQCQQIMEQAPPSGAFLIGTFNPNSSIFYVGDWLSDQTNVVSGMRGPSSSYIGIWCH